LFLKENTAVGMNRRCGEFVVPRKASDYDLSEKEGCFIVEELTSRASDLAATGQVGETSGIEACRQSVRSNGSLACGVSALRRASNKVVKSFACGSLGRSALRACSGMASPFLPDQSLHAERRLPWR